MLYEVITIAQGNRLTAYTDKGKKILEKEFRTEITSRPYIYTFAGNAKKLGVVCGGENRVYLVNMDGTLHDGFPLQGNTDFSIGYLTVGNTYFNLLVRITSYNVCYTKLLRLRYRQVPARFILVLRA